MSFKETAGEILSGMGPGLLQGVGKALTGDGKPVHFEDRNNPIDVKDLPKYKKGTDYVPKTGPAVVHKGEAVLKKEDADKYREGKVKKHNVSLYRAMHKLNKGGLHRALKVEENKEIPEDKLEQALNSKNSHIRRMANFAKTMKSFKH